jgi:hypothetical protein
MTKPRSQQPRGLRAVTHLDPLGRRKFVALVLGLAVAIGIVISMDVVAASSRAASVTGGDGYGRRGPIAVAARELAFAERGHLHLVSHYHENIVEEGHGSGTLSGNITVQMTLAFSHASVTFTAYPSSGGTVVGRGEGTIYAEGHTANFTGNATITGGTGKYAHASGRNIRLRGTLQRKTYALYVQVEGKMRY